MLHPFIFYGGTNMFTAGQAFAAIVAGLGLILTALNIADKLANIKKNADAPIKELEARVTALEIEQKEFKQSLLQGNDRFRDNETTNEVMQSCMLALIDFELSYCIHTGYTDTEDLMRAKTELRQHLARK